MRRIIRGSQCPKCPKVGNSVLEKFPKIAKEWHPVKNGDLKPEMCNQGSGKMIWWQCSQEPNHEWQSTIANRRIKNCPYCIGHTVHLTNCLATKSPELLQFWNYERNDISPYDVTSGSHRKVWWKCPCGYEWQISISNKQKTVCPCCSNKRLHAKNSLEYKKPEVAKEWDYEKNYPLTPKDVAAGTNRRAWWICSNDSNHRWKAVISSRTTPKQPSGCPVCKTSFGEKQVAMYLNNIKYIREYSFDDCYNVLKLRFDFAIFDVEDNLLMLIEYNGVQHYRPVEIFGGVKAFKLSQKKDLIKKEYCKSNGIPLLVIDHRDERTVEQILDEKLYSLVII
jgi:hypothetical protein